jgi:hypothetical protein
MHPSSPISPFLFLAEAGISPVLGSKQTAGLVPARPSLFNWRSISPMSTFRLGPLPGRCITRYHTVLPFIFWGQGRWHHREPSKMACLRAMSCSRIHLQGDQCTTSMYSRHIDRHIMFRLSHRHVVASSDLGSPSTTIRFDDINSMTRSIDK